ncbi:MAG TPA: LamG-like jellyroll fold domain-containing protein, partial [Sedimentisphaerales bacterium]|nr:LamG-like jellyroll fold domain-containing protein [Sedimentisphaerales bacterium]
NNSVGSRDWTAATTADWQDVPVGGTISPGGSVAVDALSKAEVYDRPVGRYCGDIVFTDATAGMDHSHHAVLEIKPRLMVGHWKLDETAGTIASDSSGNGNHGTLEGDLTYVFSFDTAAAAGWFGGALDFSHPNDRVDTDKTACDLELANNAAKSITSWVFTRSFNDGGIYEMGRHSNGQDFSLRTESSDNLWRVQFWGSDPATGDIDFTYNSKNRWVHFALVYDGTRAKVYADGQLVVDEPRALNTADKKTFKIGRWDDNHFDGIIDDVRLYNYALDRDAVLAIIDGGRAENPGPFDTEMDSPHSATLQWKQGATAIYQDVYFGTSLDAVTNATVNSPEYKGRQSETSYVPTVKKNTEYFWRIDQVLFVPPPPPPPPPMSGDSAEAASAADIIPGKVWNFTTGQSLGTITREVWTGISGNYVSNLTNHALYPDSPNIREEIIDFEGPIDWANNYGTRVHGFLTPSDTGSYTFWIASDDNSELWLSSDANPANQVKIAEVPVDKWTNSRQWDEYSQQQSSPVMLTAGQAYYIKALHKEGTGGDNIAVAWEMEGSCKGRQVVSGSYLSPYDTDIPTPDPMDWETGPYPTGSSSISMTAAAAYDQSGVEYYFTCTSGGGHNSGWQEGATFEDTGLEPGTMYTYVVTARDANPNHNATVPSQQYSARTFLSGDFEPDGDVDFADYARFASHWPGAASAEGQSGGEAGLDSNGADLDGDGDIDLEDLAILVEDWLGTVEQPLPLPGRAGNPDPSNGEIGVSQTADLSWTGGSNAISHDVYFGTSSPPAFRGNQTATTFDPGTMVALITYYWRIDEINQSGKTIGVVWSFTTKLNPPHPPP